MKTFKTCFRIPVEVESWVEISSREQLQQVIITGEGLKDCIIIGGGSNIILNDAKKYKILKVGIKSLSAEPTSHPEIFLLNIGAGEVWDEVVEFAVKNNLAGIEALSAIPGTAGAAPVQNIGAYGSEIRDVLESVEAVDRQTGEMKLFTNAECNFSYRQSIFKNEFKNKYIITQITLKLKKASTAQIPKYKDVQKYFENETRREVPLTEIRQAITEIRWGKLPKPEEVPNVGSFFHNPIIAQEALESLQKILPEVPFFKMEDGRYKVAAGYLIDNVGLKGFEKWGVGTYKKNALVLVNKGEATFENLQKFIDFIKSEIKRKYNIELQVEPEIVI